MFQQSRKFAAMSSSRAISGGIGNSGISVDELVYLVLDTIVDLISFFLTWFCM